MTGDLHTPEFLAARRAAMLAQPGPGNIDDGDPTEPCGHAYGVRVSSRLTSLFRQTRNIAMDVTPLEVVACLVDAGVKKWVLMGLHGYVGYLPMPRATQDVDVMVRYSERDKASRAIADRWPELTVQSLEQVVRFLDASDPDHEGKPKPVIDLMMPWSKFQETILEKYVLVDPGTGHRYPTLEAAIVSKYAPLVSPYRSFAKKSFDAGDFRNLVSSNHERIDLKIIESLASEVWEGGGAEILEFVQLAIDNKPFPV